MAKMTTEQYGRIAADVLSLPPKNRAMLERALTAKREQEDAQRQHKKVEEKPLVASASIDPGFARPVTYPVADMLQAQDRPELHQAEGQS